MAAAQAFVSVPGTGATQNALIHNTEFLKLLYLHYPDNNDKKTLEAIKNEQIRHETVIKAHFSYLDALDDRKKIAFMLQLQGRKYIWKEKILPTEDQAKPVLLDLDKIMTRIYKLKTAAALKKKYLNEFQALFEFEKSSPTKENRYQMLRFINVSAKSIFDYIREQALRIDSVQDPDYLIAKQFVLKTGDFEELTKELTKELDTDQTLVYTTGEALMKLLEIDNSPQTTSANASGASGSQSPSVFAKVGNVGKNAVGGAVQFGGAVAASGFNLIGQLLTSSPAAVSPANLTVMISNLRVTGDGKVTVNFDMSGGATKACWAVLEMDEETEPSDAPVRTNAAVCAHSSDSFPDNLWGSETAVINGDVDVDISGLTAGKFYCLYATPDVGDARTDVSATKSPSVSCFRMSMPALPRTAGPRVRILGDGDGDGDGGDGNGGGGGDGNGGGGGPPPPPPGPPGGGGGGDNQSNDDPVVNINDDDKQPSLVDMTNEEELAFLRMFAVSELQIEDNNVGRNLFMSQKGLILAAIAAAATAGKSLKQQVEAINKAASGDGVDPDLAWYPGGDEQFPDTISGTSGLYDVGNDNRRRIKTNRDFERSINLVKRSFGVDV